MQKKLFLKILLVLLVTYSFLFSYPTFAQSCSYPNDPALSTQQTDCQKDQSKIWNCSLNRCLTVQANLEIRGTTQKCLTLPEGTDAEKSAKKSCMDQTAQELTKVTSGFNESSSPVTKTAMGFSLGLALINSFAKDDKSGTCTSKSIFQAAAYGAIAGELYQYFFMKNALKKLQDDYKKGIIKEGASYEAQVKAFEFLRDEQKAIADVANKKKLLYMALTTAYGAAAAVAIVETAWPTVMTPCVSAGTPDPKGKSPATTPPAKPASAPTGVKSATFNPFQQIFISAFNTAFPTTLAASGTTDFLSILLGAGAGAAAVTYGSKNSILKNLGNSSGIAVVSSICAFLSGALISESSNTADRAKKNIIVIEEIIAKFKDDIAQFCPISGDRDNMNKPECFCYTTKNEKNPDRVNSETCKKYWEWKGHNYAVAATNYDSLKIPAQGCIDLSGGLDTNCACRKVTNTSTGSNGCLKANYKNINLGSLGTTTDLSQSAEVFDSATQGTLGSGGNIDSAQLGKNAANVQKAMDSLLAQAASKNLSTPPVKDEGIRNKFLAALATPALIKASQNGALAANNNPALLRSDLPGINEAELKSGLTIADEYQSGAGKIKKATNDSYTIPSIGGDSNNSNGKVVEGFMDKERAFKNEDIVKDNGVPIWTILSNRYMTSGYRRLFDDKSTPENSPAPKASKQ